LPAQEARLRKSTHDAYRRNIELHVIPALGKRQLDQLSAEDIDLFYAALLKGGRKKRPGEKGPTKGLAPKTVHNIHVMLNKALGDAARKGTVVRNVAALADAPSLQARKRPEIKAWEIDQLVRFLDAIAPHRMAPAFYFAAHTGMRRGKGGGGDIGVVGGVHGPHLLLGHPGVLHLVVGIAGVERGVDPLPAAVVEPLGADEQQAADVVERVALPAPMLEGVLLDALTAPGDRSVGEPHDVERVDHHGHPGQG